jgi:hypothetical protein
VIIFRVPAGWTQATGDDWTSKRTQHIAMAAFDASQHHLQPSCMCPEGGEPQVTHRRRSRFWVECALAGVSGSLLVLTLLTREWIEVILRVDPDRGSGSLEWAISAALLGTTLAFALVARLEHDRVGGGGQVEPSGGL